MATRTQARPRAKPGSREHVLISGRRVPLEQLGKSAQEQIRREHPEQIEREEEPKPAPTSASSSAKKTRSRSSAPVRVQQPSLTVGAPQVQVGGNGFWAVVVIAAVIWFISVTAGYFSAGTLLALFMLVLVGAIFPPLALGVGGVVVLYLLLTHGQNLASTISGLARASSVPQPGTYGSIFGPNGPTVPVPTYPNPNQDPAAVANKPSGVPTLPNPQPAPPGP